MTTDISPAPRPPRRWVRFTLIGLGLLTVALVLLVGAFPFSTFKGRVEGRLTERFGRPVTIGAIERAETFSFTPTLLVRDIRVPQADWAGSGALAEVRTVSISMSAWPLLLGKFSPRAIDVSGMRLNLVRDANGRKNWSKASDEDAAGGDAPQLRGLTVRDTIVTYRDAKRDRSATMRVTADSAKGVRMTGEGKVMGAPVTLSFTGPGIEGAGNTPWPFEAQIEGAALAMRAKGTMDRAFDTDRMRFAMSARADDLKRIDAIIEAGLFGTQPVAVTADLRHDGTTWEATNLKGSIGNSDIAGRLTVTKVDGRTKLDGEVRSRRLAFEDLASDAGLAEAAARVSREGPKIVPPTRVNMAKIGKTDGRIAFTIDRIVTVGAPSSLRSASGIMVLDNRRLTISPLRVGLAKGAIDGEVVVDQRDGAPEPKVTLALNLRNSSIGAFIGNGGAIDARVDARVRLVGRGSTIRAAVGRSDGTIGVLARDGSVPERMATLLGFDVGRSLFADKTATVALRCAGVRLRMRGGTGTIDPLVIDTTMSQTRATGRVTFPAEAISATLTGAPKHDSLLRLPGSIAAGGTIRAPEVIIPRETKSVGNFLKAIGRAISGNQGPTATDADCGRLASTMLG